MFALTNQLRAAVTQVA